MSPARFTELVIVGLNLSLLITFLAWRFVGPGQAGLPGSRLRYRHRQRYACGKLDLLIRDVLEGGVL